MNIGKLRAILAEIDKEHDHLPVVIAGEGPPSEPIDLLFNAHCPGICLAEDDGEIKGFVLVLCPDTDDQFGELPYDNYPGMSDPE